MHILIAPNAFKNALSASAAAEAIEKGLLQSGLACTTECFPIADGGDGTADLIIRKLNGVRVPVKVHDPLGRMIDSVFGLIDNGHTAVIEMADASGLRLLKPDELNPLRATSYGTGELISTALDKGVKKIIVAMGGSATVDGATGLLSALGFRFLDKDGHELTGLPGSLQELDRIDNSAIDARMNCCEIIVLCDVDNRLLGDKGAAAIFGPQKGASPDAVKILDGGLARLHENTFKQTGKNMAIVKYGGAAGGAAAGVYAWLNAALVNGIDHFMELTHFEEALKRCNVVITGEGSIDEQTLQGKGPFGVASRAKLKNIPVIGLAGKIPAEPSKELKACFEVLMTIRDGPCDLQTALANTEKDLIRIGPAVAGLIRSGIN